MAYATVGLNIGGQVYRTSSSTLNRACVTQNSILASINQGQGMVHQDPHGNFFIDRDGAMFRHILNYLRTGKLLLPDNFEEFELLIEEARFYGLTQLEEAVRAAQKPSIQYLRLKKDNGLHYTLYGQKSVIQSIPELNNINIYTTPYREGGRFNDLYVNASNLNPETDGSVSFNKGTPWSRIAECLTKNKFTCKSVAYGCGGIRDGFKESEIWLFERKNVKQ